MLDSQPPASGPQPRKRIALICDSLEDNFQSALVEAGLDSTLMIIPGMGHGVMELDKARWAELQRSVVDFFERTLG